MSIDGRRGIGLFPCIMFSVVVLAGCSISMAQVLLPKDYAGKCRVRNQEAIVVFHDGRESLVLEARYDFTLATQPRPMVTRGRRGQMPGPAPAAELAPPSEMAWIVPILPGATLAKSPSEGMFEDLYDWIHPSVKARYGLRTGRPRGLNRFSESVFSSRLDSNHTTLAWNIVPGTGEVALASLFAWVESNNLQGLNQNLCRDYAQRGWTFAAATLSKPGLSGSLGPVHFTFPTTDAVFPLNFQSNLGVYDLNFYFLTGLDVTTRHLSGLRLTPVRGLATLSREAQSHGYATLATLETPPSLVEYLAGVRSSAITGLPEDTLRFYAWEGKGMGGYGSSMSRMAKDLSISEKKAPQPVLTQKSPTYGTRQPQRATRSQTSRRRMY
jgi:hypothetical protein